LRGRQAARGFAGGAAGGVATRWRGGRSSFTPGELPLVDDLRAPATLSWIFALGFRHGATGRRAAAGRLGS
jgi:hypothetical protein